MFGVVWFHVSFMVLLVLLYLASSDFTSSSLANLSDTSVGSVPFTNHYSVMKALGV